MLPARTRMRRHRDFDAAVRRGRRVNGRWLVAHLGGNQATGEPPKVGFVVSRAVGDAPCRNRVRRRLRHLVRDRVDRVPPDCLLVIRAKPAAAHASSAKLAADLDTVLGRLSGALDNDR